ncbi:MAG: maleylpyruvate isomerase family mycothiol-dependent enzyme [Actinobacteria bacterium]|nr:maleylpyruvate isomerase family mycothiol-dependent enzyme [Actinomycetota bacterium]
MTATAIRLEDLPKPAHQEWFALGEAIDHSLLATLESLTADEWNTPTECAPWTVKDIMAHLIGWGEAVVSPRTLVAQGRGGWKARAAHNGNWLDATNQYQVDSKASVSSAEIVERFKKLAPRFHKTRNRYGLVTGVLPMKEPFSGTWIPVRFLFDTIFVRDHFMHHIDICTALGRPLPIGAAERRVAHDVFREWAEKAGASVTLELTGPAGGTFVAGSGDTKITGDAIDLCRVLAGRKCDTFEISGDEAAARRWLKVLVVF